MPHKMDQRVSFYPVAGGSNYGPDNSCQERGSNASISYCISQIPRHLEYLCVLPIRREIFTDILDLFKMGSIL